MNSKDIEAGIAKLEFAHRCGVKIRKLLDQGEGKQYRKVGYRDAAKEISDDNVTISEASARHYATFANRFTADELDQLGRDSRLHGHVPSFDVVVRLMAVRDKRKRKKLTREVLVNKWNKIRLGQEMRRRNATEALKERDEDSQVEQRSRGRKPRAVSSVENLLGELHDDAIKWRRVYQALAKQVESETKDSVGWSVKPELLGEIEALADTLNGFFDWEA